MNNDKAIRNWQASIILQATAKLGRELTDRERQFINGRGGFLALEAISDTVSSESREYVERYLNSD